MKVVTHKRNAQKSIKKVNEWNIKETEKKRVKEFLKEYLSGRITQRRGNNPDALIEKVSQTLRIGLENLENVTKKDLEKFFDKLIVHDKILSYNKKTKKFNGEPYSHRNKQEIINSLKRYLLWRYKKESLIIPLNIKISFKEKDIDSLELSEINKMYKGCSSNQERYIVGVLFSSGTRAEEFLNLKLSDFIMPEKDGFIKVRIRSETTKTKPRTISLYYNKSFEAVTDYIKERKEQGMKPNDYILKISYGSLKNLVSRIGKKSLDKRVYPHLLRHSSATWLSSKMNRQQLCIFFGWAFSSNMPDRYISREGVNMKDVDMKQTSSNYDELELKIEQSNFEKNKLKEQFEELKENSVSKQNVLRMVKQALMKTTGQVKN